jgi:hypothetical protein
MLPSLRSLVLVLISLASAAASAGAQRPSPDLVVVISLDQFRADYLQRFRPYFGSNGFNLLLSRGAVFSDCHHRHALTNTGPGHAAMLTGTFANTNGIIENDWIDRTTLQPTNCVSDPSVDIIGRTIAAQKPEGRSPRNLNVTNVCDEFKLARGGKPKVIGIANKDRAAILMSGHLADAAYFMQEGSFVSSTYYMKQVPAWVAAWNQAGKANSCFGRVWDRVLPATAYEIQGLDDMEGEYTGGGLGRTFPKKITGGENKPGPAFFSSLSSTPFASELLADFAKAAVTHENLGKRGTTDILCLGFSAPDAIGHNYGPNSHEVMDNAVRTDRILADFFDFLEGWVGLNRCTIILTADHGAPPMPEYLRATGRDIPTGRMRFSDAARAEEKALNARFGPLADKGPWLVNYGLIQPSALKEKNLDPKEVEAVMRDAALQLPWVQAVYTRSQLVQGDVEDGLGHQAFLSFNRERSGDLMVLVKPYFFQRDVGVSHGSPYNYDTHVPLLWYGVGVPRGERTERVGIDDLAPTLSHLLGIPAPPKANGRVLF